MRPSSYKCTYQSDAVTKMLQECTTNLESYKQEAEQLQ